MALKVATCHLAERILGRVNHPFNHCLSSSPIFFLPEFCSAVCFLFLLSCWFFTYPFPCLFFRFWFRLYWFPLKVLYASYITSLQSVPNIPFYFFFNALLFALLLMNIYWFLVRQCSSSKRWTNTCSSVVFLDCVTLNV